MQNKGITQREKSHRSQSTRDPNNKRKGQRNSQEEGKGSLMRMLWSRLQGQARDGTGRRLHEEDMQEENI